MVFLLVPIVILNMLNDVTHRMVVIVVAAAVLVIALSSFTNSRTVEVFICGAT